MPGGVGWGRWVCRNIIYICGVKGTVHRGEKPGSQGTAGGAMFMGDLLTWETWADSKHSIRRVNWAYPPASLRLPLSGQTLRLCDLCRRHLGGNQVAVLGAIG